MNNKITCIGGALATALLAPGLAGATMLLDTGVPNDPATAYTLNSGQWFAGEFHATAGEDIQSVAAYLTQGSANVGYQLSFDLYSNSSSTGLLARATSRSILDTVNVTYTADGWTSAAVNWTVPTDGDYWLAIQVTNTSQTGSLDLPGVATQTGAAAAEGFALSTNGAQYKAFAGDGVGLQVSTVPLPAGFWLFASGLLGLGAFAGRQRVRHFIHNISAAAIGIQAEA